MENETIIVYNISSVYNCSYDSGIVLEWIGTLIILLCLIETNLLNG